MTGCMLGLPNNTLEQIHNWCIDTELTHKYFKLFKVSVQINKMKKLSLNKPSLIEVTETASICIQG